MMESLRAFCQSVCAVDVPETDPTHSVQADVRRFLEALDASRPHTALHESIVREYMNVPNHLQACIDLDFQRFSATRPLMMNGVTLVVHDVLEAFSRTNPVRYAEVWLPLLDLAIAMMPLDGCDGLLKARSHVLTLRDNPSPLQGVADPSGTLDGVMNNILTAFPGLQDIVQKMMAAGSTPDGIPAVMNQIQSLLYPLLTQSSAQDPNGPDLQPAVAQILQGFSTLTETLARSSAPSHSPVPDTMME